jgi:nucleoside-triphosphatase THEP1
MSVSRFDRSPDAAPLAAVVYPNEAYPQATFQRVVNDCRSRALKLAGVLQHPVCDDPAHRCDVILEDLVSGARTELFERRGKGATGCRLDVAALTDVTARIERALQHDVDLLVLNKFGKVEAEGGGLVDPIAAAIDRGIPVIIGVPARNLAAWRAFAGDLAVEFVPDFSGIAEWLEFVCGERAADKPLLKAS